MVPAKFPQHRGSPPTVTTGFVGVSARGPTGENGTRGYRRVRPVGETPSRGVQDRTLGGSLTVPGEDTRGERSQPHRLRRTGLAVQRGGGQG